MAFQTASGYGNLPNGNFSPVIYSQKVQKTFRKSSVVEDVTNTDYMGEIANYGDSVRIIKEPEIAVSSYARGTTLATQDITDADFSLVIDQANYFQFAIDDIESAHSHVNFMELATDRAAYRLRDEFDAEVMGYMSGYEKNSSGVWVPRTAPNGTKADAGADADELFASNKLDAATFGGVSGDSIQLAPSVASGSGVASPLAVLNRIARQMDLANVDTESRWVIVDPVFIEMLMDENSKLVDADFGGNGELQNGKVFSNLRGFKVYKSNNLPFVGTGAGATAGGATDFGVIVAGHNSAVATAQQIDKTESFRDPNTFADKVRGMQLYGRKILRPEALFTAAYSLA